MSATQPSPKLFSLRRHSAALFQRDRSAFGVLDGLRAIAILLVLSYHCFVGLEYLTDTQTLGELIKSSPWWIKWVWEGTHGADLSLLLSGFLIGHILFKELNQRGEIDIKRFYMRRWMRLTPAYFTCLLLLACFVPMAELWYYPLFVSNFVAPDKQVMTWAWSLAVETQFYLLFPFFLLLCQRYTRNYLPVLIGVWLLALVVRWGLLVREDYFRAFHLSAGPLTELGKQGALRHFDVLYDNLYTRLGSLFSGVIAAYINTKYRTEVIHFFSANSRWANVFFTVAIAVIVCTSYQKGFDPFWDYSQFLPAAYIIGQHHVFTAACAYLIIYCLHPPALGKWLETFLAARIWFPLSQLSYSIYLYHLIVLSAVLPPFKASMQVALHDPVMMTAQLFSVFLVTFIVSAVLAFFSYVFIEKPMIELRVRWEQRRAAFLAAT